jgi:hypothetical protein
MFRMEFVYLIISPRRHFSILFQSSIIYFSFKGKCHKSREIKLHYARQFYGRDTSVPTLFLLQELESSRWVVQAFLKKIQTLMHKEMRKGFDVAFVVERKSLSAMTEQE